LATEEELQQLTHILFGRKFNPIDYLQLPDPAAVQNQTLSGWLDALERRFRYLAADGMTVLSGKTQAFSYRQTLIQVCHYLKIPYSNAMSTTDIESEIFLHLMGKAWKKLPKAQQNSMTRKIQESLAQKQFPEALPVQLQHNPVNLILKGSSAIAINSLIKPWLLRQLAEQFALHFAQYQMARSALLQGGAAVTTQIAVRSAQRGMVASASRYGAIRTIFSFMGPVLWGWFLADLGWRAISTNYGRIIPVIFALAQIRLTRTDCWQPA
jgi:uncharacterized protein YaaW (UPF0174 family)